MAGGFFSGLIHSGDKHRLTGPLEGGRVGFFHLWPSYSKVFPYCCKPLLTTLPFSSNWHLIRGAYIIRRDQYRRHCKCRSRLILLVNYSHLLQTAVRAPVYQSNNQHKHSYGILLCCVGFVCSGGGLRYAHTVLWTHGGTALLFFHAPDSVSQNVSISKLERKGWIYIWMYTFRKWPQRLFFPCRAEYIHLEATTKEVFLN